MDARRRRCERGPATPPLGMRTPNPATRVPVQAASPCVAPTNSWERRGGSAAHCQVQQEEVGGPAVTPHTTNCRVASGRGRMASSRDRKRKRPGLTKARSAVSREHSRFRNPVGRCLPGDYIHEMNETRVKVGHRSEPAQRHLLHRADSHRCRSEQQAVESSRLHQSISKRVLDVVSMSPRHSFDVDRWAFPPHPSSPKRVLDAIPRALDVVWNHFGCAF